MRLTTNVTRPAPGIVILTLRGTLDGETYALVDGEVGKILGEPIRTMVLDLAGVDFITSAGVGTIMKAKTSLAKRDAEFAMIGMQPQVQKVFEIIHLLPRMQVFQGQAELDEYLTRIQRQMTGQEDD